MKRVAVIGAGPMGLAAAYQLARDGFAPVLFEADDRVGGTSAMFDFDGVEIERFHHFYCTSDAALFELLAELGIADQLRWGETKMGYWFEGRLQPWDNPVALLRFKGLGWVAKLRYSLHAFISTHRTDWRPLDHVEATDWLKWWIGDEAYEKLWHRLFEQKFWEYSTNLSAAWIWARIRRIGTSRYNLMREKAGYLEGGSATLLDALRADIEAHGGELRLSSPVSRVVLADGRVTGVEVDGRFEPFDAVISTIPLPYVPRLIPGLPAEITARFAALHNIPCVGVIVKLARPLSGFFWLNTNDPQMQTPGMVEYTALRPLGVHIVYVPYYVPATNPLFAAPDDALAEQVTRYMKTINPALTDADFLGVRVHRYRYAQPICSPGYLDDLPPAKLPVDGLWVADTSHYYPEDRGVAESIAFGRKLAREVAE